MSKTRMRTCRAFVLAVPVSAVLLGCSGSNSLDSAGPVADQTALSTASVDGQTVALRQVDKLPPPANTGGGQDQLIAPNDELQIDVFDVDQLDRTVQVDSRGRVSLPLIGTIEAAGKSPHHLERELERKYGANYLQSPDISVYVKNSVSQQVTVDGEVGRKGRLPVTSGTTLMQVIAQAGGFSTTADTSKIYVYRQFDNEKLVTNFDVSAIRAARQPDPKIYGGDFVMVFSSDTKVAMENLKQALGLASSASRAAVAPGF